MLWMIADCVFERKGLVLSGRRQKQKNIVADIHSFLS